MHNKRLKKRLKKYERIGTKDLSYDGLFEVRVQNLPHDKKRELEAILQRFASTIRPRPTERASNLASSARTQGTRSRVAGNDHSPCSPPYTNGLDSAYASVSATGATFNPTSGRSGNSISRSRSYISFSAKQELHTSTHTRSHGIESPRLPETSDRHKQRLVVERVEELFLTDNVDIKSIIESNLHALSPQSKDPSKEADQIPNSHSTKNQARSPPDDSRFQRYPGVTSPAVGSGAEFQHGWVYLNLLINLAQLHTLNVTPEFVRSGIQTISTKLVLSEDGSAVRWQRDLEHSVASSTDSDNLADTRYALTAATLARPESEIRPPEYQASNDKPRERVGHLQTFGAGQEAAKRLQYKPLFARHRQRPRGFSCGSSAPSQGSRSSFSDTRETSTPDFRGSTNAPNGPLVFFDGDAFFVDLSSDPTDAGNIGGAGHSSYASHYVEPLGQRNCPAKVSWEFERKQDIPSLGPKRSEEWDRSPPLLVYDDNPISAQDENHTVGGERFQFQASGMGGIQLSDNLAIELQTSQQPVSHPSRPSSPPTNIISTTTTHLPPSPLPPPSYVYPALPSSESSGSEDEYSSLDDLESEPDYELRKVSLSPQVRAWVQEQSMSPHGPQGGDGWSDEDGDSSERGDGGGD